MIYVACRELTAPPKTFLLLGKTFLVYYTMEARLQSCSVKPPTNCYIKLLYQIVIKYRYTKCKHYYFARSSSLEVQQLAAIN